MERSKSLLAIVALLFAIFTVKSSGQDFDAAREAIEAVPPSKMDYKTFCVPPLSRGRYKTACRIASVPSVVLLVCSAPEVDGKPCGCIIKDELNYLDEIATKTNIRTVSFDPKPIAPLKCGRNKTKFFDCTGFMEGWIDPKEGWFEHLSNIFRVDATGALIERVMKKTNSGGLYMTAFDLLKIEYFMVYPDETQYRQICDLQGFFLTSGGFLVSDPEGVEVNMAYDQLCYSDDSPTTKQVLSSLDKMILAFSPAEGGGA